MEHNRTFRHSAVRGKLAECREIILRPLSASHSPRQRGPHLSHSRLPTRHRLQSFERCHAPACSDGLLTAHGLLDQPYNHHQDAPAHTAGSDLADNGTDIKASRSGRFRSAAEELTYDLCAYAAADNTGDLLPIVPKSYCFSAEPAMLPPTPPAISWMIRPTTPPHIVASSRCSPSGNVDWSDTLGGARYRKG
jgi:hypothetical protein